MKDKSNGLRVWPEVAARFRPLNDAEMAALRESLATDGQRHAVLALPDGRIIDGQHRWQILGGKTARETLDVPEAHAFRLALALNTARRQMTPEQMGETRRWQRDTALAARKEGKTLAEAALLAGVGKSTVSRWERERNNSRTGNASTPRDHDRRVKVAASEYPDIATMTGDRGLAATAAEYDITERRVQQIIKRVERDAEKERARRQAARAARTIPAIIIGDFRTCADKVPDGSIDLIFTDPPYDRDAETLFAGLADFAAAKLLTGGSLVFYCGHLQLPAAFLAFAGKLRHWWTCACVHAGGKALMREYGVRVGWKPMLWFVKDTRADRAQIVLDTVTGAREKDHHDWQQSEVEAAHWIKALCPPSGTVCDPFLGGGTTAVAARRLDRRWVGFEKDKATARIAAGRIGK